YYFLCMLPRPPSSTPLPYTTLFRSGCCRGGMIRYRDWASLVARRQREQRARRDEPPVHGVLGCRDTPENQQAICRLLIAAGTLSWEEHTSELQSRSDLVCRLLLEKI